MAAPSAFVMTSQTAVQPVQVNVQVITTPQSTLDLDQILTSWAAERLGGVVNKIDGSDVQVTQLSVVYKSDKDWFNHQKAHEEIFDNPGSSISTWKYEETVKFSSKASWTIVNGYKSSVLPPHKLHIEFPMGEESHEALRGVFEKTNAGLTVEAIGESKWKLNSTVNVKPLSTTKASAEIKTCRLEDVPFTTDIQMSGRLKISGNSGSKKGSKPGKHVEISVNIEEALGSRPEFTVVETAADDVINGDAYENNKHVRFRIEGRCTGEVGIEARVRLNEVQSLV